MYTQTKRHTLQLEKYCVVILCSFLMSVLVCVCSCMCIVCMCVCAWMCACICVCIHQVAQLVLMGVQKCKLDILGVSETKWMRNGAKNVDDCYAVYSGVSDGRAKMDVVVLVTEDTSRFVQS